MGGAVYHALKTGLKVFGIAEAALFATGMMLDATNSHGLEFGSIGDGPVAPGQSEDVAKQFLDRVDWSSPTIVIWVPGINSPPGVRDDFQNGLKDIHSPYWMGALEYPRNANIQQNVPIGSRALELVLDEIHRRDPDGTRYRVAVGGESLGAIVAATAMGKPSGNVVDKAAFFGTPGTTPDVPAELKDRVRSYRRFWDPIALPFIGSSQLWAQGGDLGFGGAKSALPGAIVHCLLNPFQSAVAGVTTLQMTLAGKDGFRNHPHNYWAKMPDAASFMIDE